MQIYVVKSGDTLEKIASEFSVSEEKIITENKLTHPNNLVVGQTIVITEDTPKIATIAVNGYLYPNIDKSTLRETLPYLTFVTIFTYGFNEDGELIEPIGDEAGVISLAQEYGVKPVMLLSSLSEEGVFSNELASTLLNNEILQDKLIQKILDNLVQKNYYALDIDFEYVFPKDRIAYVNFIKKVTTILNEQGYPVIVALAPKTSSEQKGLLYEAHDYSLIGKSSNAVLLMTYEWGYTYGPPMAVAPINKVHEVLDYAIKEIPPNKIFMGIPNYGYNWPLPYVRGETVAKSISNVGAVDLARDVGAEIKYDEVSQAPYFYYTDEKGIEHVVWFEDARSIYAKLMLIYEYGFVGVSYWNIMKFYPQNWLVLSQLFNIIKI